jgi:acetyl esterase/lipase
MKQSRAFTITLLATWAFTMSAKAQAVPPKLPADAEFAGEVAYVKAAHPRQRLDIAFSRQGKPRPLLVWIHGGAFMGGDKAENHAIWPELMKSGYAVATINYRLSGDAKWPAQITDCKAAIRFLRAHAQEYNLAPGHIGVWGSSAGGHLAALVGTSGGARKLDVGEYLDQSSAVSCAVDLFGPIDFEKMPQFDSPTSPEARMWGRATAEALDLAREACPITYLSKDTPPILILHGDADGVVHISQSQLFDAAIKKAGATGEFVTLPGVGHSHVEVWIKERERIMTFFKRHLSEDVKARGSTSG